MFTQVQIVDQELPWSFSPPSQTTISELRLSVRARKGVVRALRERGLLPDTGSFQYRQVETLDVDVLCRLTEDDLLEQRSFGITSLNEVKKRLALSGRSLTEGR